MVQGFAAVAGKKEGEGPLAAEFDHIFDDTTLGEVSWEKAETEKIHLKENIQTLYEKVEKELSQRERIILKMRYGLYNGEEYTQREIARQLGISRSYVSRIEKGAVEKLRKSFS